MPHRTLPAIALLLLGRPALAEPACRADGWCWVNPAPQGNDLHDVYASSPRDAWAVGDHGTLLHWDGGRWTPRESGVGERLRAVAGNGPHDVWAVGDLGAAIHSDGDRWQLRRVPGLPRELGDVWVSPAGHAWAVGGDAVARWDGSGWTVEAVPGARFATVWGSADEDVWAGGGEFLRRWDGTHWSDVPLPAFSKQQQATKPGVARVRGTARDQMLAIFASEESDGVPDLEAFAWDGRAWSPLPARFRAAGGIWALHDLWVPQRDRAWLRLDFSRAPVPPYHFRRADGRWAQEKEHERGLDGMNPSRLGGALDGDGWAVGECGGLARWNGRRWKVVSTNPATVASQPPDPDAVHWQSLAGARLSRDGRELWLSGRWPADEQGPSRWYRVDLERRALAAARGRGGQALPGTERRELENQAGDRWELRDVGSDPHAATIVRHSIAGAAQPPVAFPRLRGAYLDAHGAFWGWGDCGTVVTQAAGSRAPAPR